MFNLVVHVGNKKSIDIYKVMSSFEIWIKYIYELDNLKTAWKSINIYRLPQHVFCMSLFNIFYYLICKYEKICLNNITRR